jgi:hypothetical protein
MRRKVFTGQMSWLQAVSEFFDMLSITVVDYDPAPRSCVYFGATWSDSSSLHGHQDRSLVSPGR